MKFSFQHNSDKQIVKQVLAGRSARGSGSGSVGGGGARSRQRAHRAVY